MIHVDDDRMQSRRSVTSTSGVSVAVPEDLLSYFDSDPMPCPVIGCRWRGAKVGQHCNMKHGIAVGELRELLGANKLQGMCTKSFGDDRSRLTKTQVHNVLISGEARYPILLTRHTPRKATRQSRQQAIVSRESEHIRQKLRAAGQKSREPVRRKRQSEIVRKTWESMSRIDVTCDECGIRFTTFSNQRYHVRFCCNKCRCAWNNRRRRGHSG